MDKISKEILFSKDAIRKKGCGNWRIKYPKDYEGKELIVIGILKGAFIFMADLIREISIPCRVDFARLASYGAGSESSGKVVMTKDIETSIKDKDILIVEDILDTGLTMQYLVDWLEERNPRSLKICVFLDKEKEGKCLLRLIMWALPLKTALSWVMGWISMRSTAFHLIFM